MAEIISNGTGNIYPGAYIYQKEFKVRVIKNGYLVAYGTDEWFCELPSDVARCLKMLLPLEKE